jgi:hypothetical protein
MGDENRRLERVEVTVPAGKLHVQHARCPNGCSLMSETMEIGGYPAITVTGSYRGKSGTVHLDPAYGSFNNIVELDIPDGEVVEFSCPHCGVSLRHPTETCNTCSSPTFVLHLPHGSLVEGCQRKGCFSHKLLLAELGDQLASEFSDHGLDVYL